jgi:hypothetical protein
LVWHGALAGGDAVSLKEQLARGNGVESLLAADSTAECPFPKLKIIEGGYGCFGSLARLEGPQHRLDSRFPTRVHIAQILLCYVPVERVRGIVERLRSPFCFTYADAILPSADLLLLI